MQRKGARQKKHKNREYIPLFDLTDIITFIFYVPFWPL